MNSRNKLIFASEGSVMRATLENNLGGVGYINIFFHETEGLVANTL